jgi:membrane complex biogenesis BtpA family protein
VSWLKEVLGTEKPVIAMCHLQAMPGDPDYDEQGGMEKVLDFAKKDFLALQEGGVDAVMFSNEFSLPYLLDVKTETVAAMACIIGELKRYINIPFGVNVLWDPYKSLDLAAATGALFIREIMSGVYASDFGLWNTNTGNVVRHRARLGAKHIKLLFNIVPEASAYLGERDVASIAKTTVFNNKPDALCVSGLTAGAETDTQILKIVRETVPDVVLFCNTGCNHGNIGRQLAVSDGVIVGTTFKEDGKFENAVDKKRVDEFMSIVKQYRA